MNGTFNAVAIEEGIIEIVAKELDISSGDCNRDTVLCAGPAFSDTDLVYDELLSMSILMGITDDLHIDISDEAFQDFLHGQSRWDIGRLIDCALAECNPV